MGHARAACRGRPDRRREGLLEQNRGVPCMDGRRDREVRKEMADRVARAASVGCFIVYGVAPWGCRCPRTAAYQGWRDRFSDCENWATSDNPAARRFVEKYQCHKDR